jgi:FAD/FMN-containing dehydrogenase
MLDSLRADMLLTSDDAGWDDARRAFNLAVDQRPAAIARPRSAEDVIPVVKAAAAEGLRVAPQRTGHAASALEALDGAVLLKTEALQEIEIDSDARRARVGAGVQWGQVSELASEAGLSALMGSSPNVGVAGYTLGGGLSFIGRKHGLAASSVEAIELVTAAGDAIRVEADNEPELFWALRGGGGSFGVVTALEFALFEEARIYAGAAFFPFERAAEVLHAWREITLDAPEELTTLGRLVQVPDVPGPPEHMRGRAFAVVEAVYLGEEHAGAGLLEPVLDLGPQFQTLGMVPPVALSFLHMDPPEPVPARTGHVMLGELPAEAVDAFVAVAGPGSDSPLVSAELRQTGGALGRPDPSAGALTRLPGSYSAFAVGSLMNPALEPAVADRLDRIAAALKPYEAGRYLNYSDSPEDGSAFFDADTHQRLQTVKAAWDPEGLFQCTHPIAAG